LFLIYKQKLFILYIDKQLDFMLAFLLKKKVCKLFK